MRKLFGVIVILLLVTGCMKNEKKTDAATVMTVKPVDLFNGDNAKFKSFLGTMSGAFKLSYQGEKPNAGLALEIWQKGKAAVPAGSIGDVFFNLDDKKNKEVEVILAMEDDANAKSLRIKLGTVNDSGSGVTTFTLPIETNLKARGLVYDPEPRSFALEENAAVPLWAMQATSSNEIRTTDLSLEALKEQEWALVVLLRPTN